MQIHYSTLVNNIIQLSDALPATRSGAPSIASQSAALRAHVSASRAAAASQCLLAIPINARGICQYYVHHGESTHNLERVPNESTCQRENCRLRGGAHTVMECTCMQSL